MLYSRMKRTVPVDWVSLRREVPRDYFSRRHWMWKTKRPRRKGQLPRRPYSVCHVNRDRFSSVLNREVRDKGLQRKIVDHRGPKSLQNYLAKMFVKRQLSCNCCKTLCVWLQKHHKHYYKRRKCFREFFCSSFSHILSAPKSRDSLWLPRRLVPLPRRIARFLRPQDSGTAKGGRPWRGSVKIEPGFFQVFLKTRKNPVKTRKKTGKKTRLKPGKSLLENVESTQKVGDLVMSWRTGGVPLTYLPGEKPGKNPAQFFTDPLLTDPFWPEPKDVRSPCHQKSLANGDFLCD